MWRSAVYGVVQTPAPVFATWGAHGSAIALTGGNLISTNIGDGKALSTIGKSAGVWYWEITPLAGNGSLIGIASIASDLEVSTGLDANSWAYYKATGQSYHNAVAAAYGAAYAFGDTIGLLLDMNAGELTMYKNDVSQGVMVSGLTGAIYAAVGNTGQSAAANFGATAFVGTVPPGANAGLYS